MNETTIEPLPAIGTITIHGQPFYAPTSLEFIGVLDDVQTEAARKSFPPLIYVDFLETEDAAKKLVKRSGVLAPWKPKNFTAILDGWTPDAAALKQLRQLQAEIESLDGEYEKYSNPQAERDWKAQRENETQRRADTQLGDASSIRSLSEIKYEYRVKRQAVDDSIAPLTRKAATLAQPVIAAALEQVKCSMCWTESGERETSDYRELAWVPSLYWRAHAAILVRMTGTTTIEKLCQGVTPKNMLVGIVNL